MKRTPSTYPSFLTFCVAAIIGAPLAASAGIPEFAQPVSSAPAKGTDRLIVKYKDALSSSKHAAKVPSIGQARAALMARAGQQFGLAMKALHTTANGAHVIQLSKKMTLAEVTALAQELAERDPSVEYAEPDRIMHALFAPNDPRYAEQWHYFEATGGMRLPGAWDQSTGVGVNVAVIDTGYRPHADLAGRLLPGYDFITSATIANDGGGRDNDPSDPGDAIVAGECGNGQPASDRTSSWHGTHVAGTIAAATNNGLGVAGVAFGAKVLPVRVLGKCGGYTSDIADAIIWSSGGAVAGAPANANPARVINMSLGGDGACDVTTQNAINSARSRGSVLIIAAGNDNMNASNASPANCAGVVTVAATNRSGGRAYYSNYGAVVDVAAPGGDARTSGGGILSTLNSGTRAPGTDTYAYFQGTSMATPHVAGVAALMLAKTPGLTPDEIEARLKASARPFPATCTSCGAGIVDANAALGGGTVIVQPPVTNATETEANNTTASANPVSTSGVNVSGNMGSSSDTDYFAVQLPAGKTLSATLVAATSTSDYDLFAYNSVGSRIAASENPAGASDYVSMTNTGSATITRYIRVVYYSGGTGATNGRYALKLSW